ncbi:SDR family oxidoreductase [Marinivivus vitaminiproducens]|uniref:SDR family oxidoreductase n=1 Tax=Marinivivus vitaminiproducens TaxID=3035935 RepID=UPI0027A69FAD|nr:SDR family oxidoreductase [Geminicoccaceae bacterium SCSIO 64248]
MTGTTWLILGASSAIARAFALQAAQAGCDVLLAGRDQDDLGATAADVRVRTGRGAEAVPFDALDYAGHAAFAEDVAGRGGRLNVLLAFGTMTGQEEAERDFGAARAMIESNYLGAVSILSRLAPVLERQGAGRLVVIGSVAGDRGRASNHVYGSAKAGLHAFTSGLRARLFRSGVTVTLIKPGFVDTAMTWPLGLKRAASPESVAAAVLKAADKGRAVAYVPFVWLGVMTIIRLIPNPIFKRLKI